MLDDNINENLQSVLESIYLVEARFEEIAQANDFLSSSAGVLILDAVAMRLQIVGELLKKVDKINSSFLRKYPEIEWNKIMRLRDIISHHYEMIDHEIIYDICRNHIPHLKTTVKKIIKAKESR